MVILEKLFNKIVIYAIEHNSSDIHIDFTKNKQCQICLRILGKINKVGKIELENALKLVNYILFKSNIDIINQQTLHTGIINFEYNNKIIYLRVSVVYALNNKSIVIRLLNNHQKVSLNNLSLINNNIEDLNKILELKNGLVIFSGKTGSGKTTTLYAIIEELNKISKKKIVSIEDPVERELDDILQISINQEQTSYFKVLKQVLRHDPDVIVIGEIRDENDLKLVVQAALSGHLVLTSMHSMSALFAINRLLELNINVSDLKSCLKLISYQELFYYKANKVFSLFEFINNDELINYLNNKEIKYLKIEDYKNALKKELNFSEGK